MDYAINYSMFRANLAQLSDQELLKLRNELEQISKSTKISSYFKLFRARSILMPLLMTAIGAGIGALPTSDSESLSSSLSDNRKAISQGALVGAGIGLVYIIYKALQYKGAHKRLIKLVDEEIKRRGLKY